MNPAMLEPHRHVNQRADDPFFLRTHRFYDGLAKVGSTGRVTGPHLHFEIRKRNVAQDPVRYLPQLCCHRASDSVDRNG